MRIPRKRLRLAAMLGLPPAIDAVYYYEVRRLLAEKDHALSRLPPELALTIRVRSTPGWPGPDPQPALSCTVLDRMSKEASA
jgi:hypothetical protein